MRMRRFYDAFFRSTAATSLSADSSISDTAPATQPAQNHPLQRIMQGITGSDASVGTIATKGVNGLSKTLKNVQQVLHVVQSATPIVQEYGPMVKNIPAMYRMIKSFQDIEDAPEDKEQINSNNVENPGNTKIPTADSGRKPEADSRGQSTPKLFI